MNLLDIDFPVLETVGTASPDSIKLKPKVPAIDLPKVQNLDDLMSLFKSETTPAPVIQAPAQKNESDDEGFGNFEEAPSESQSPELTWQSSLQTAEV